MPVDMEYLRENYPETLIMDGYDDCIVGICTRFGQEPIVAYDREKVIAKLMKDGMDETEAVEWFDFNQIGAWMGNTTPLLHRESSHSLQACQKTVKDAGMKALLGSLLEVGCRYYLWVPFAIGCNILGAYAAWRMNVGRGGAWFWVGYALGVSPLWLIIAAYSRRLVWDGLLFDVLLVLSWTATTLTLTNSWTTLKPLHLLAVGLVVVGLVLFKL